MNEHPSIILKVGHTTVDELKGYPSPLYKYCDWENPDYKTILKDQIVFFARPSSFPDPKDCKLTTRYDLYTDDLLFDKYIALAKIDHPDWKRHQQRQFAKEWVKKSLMKDPIWVKKIETIFSKMFDDSFGVLSLTAHPDNFEMRDSYSNHHTGFCVGFHSQKLFQNLGGGGNVTYFDILPEILPTDEEQIEHMKQVFSKERKWKYEQEYRTHIFNASLSNDENRKRKIPTECFC